MTIARGSGLQRPPIRAVDLFCGVGGLTHGLSRGGVNVVAGIDIDTSCRYPYEANNEGEFLRLDVSDVGITTLDNLLEDAKFTLLAGCAPCQPFSTYSRQGRSKRENSDWALVENFGQLVRDLQPHFVTMENVPSLALHPVYKRFLNYLEGYHISWSIVECSHFGVPQTRKRLVLLASRLGSRGLSLATCNKDNATVRKTIENLPKLSAGEGDPSDPLHRACNLTEINLKRIRASRPGGSWRDWPISLRAACHKRTTGNTYPSVYGRMEWDAPAPTITTQCFGYGNGRFGHPDQDRAITLREAAMLQTFPRNYAFVPDGEPISFARLGKLIGNAVPVRLGEVIAETFHQHLRKYSMAL